MEELQELSYILTKYKTQSIEIIGDDSKQYNSKLYQLFQIIQNGEAKNDNQAALAIYGEEKISVKYRNLKYELKKRLLNTILFIDTNNQKSRSDVYYQCWKEWATCRVLIGKSARKTAVKIAERIFRKAQQFDFYELAVSVSVFLREHYGTRDQNKEKFEYYDANYDYYKRQLKYNNLAYKYYMKLILDHATDGVMPNPQIEKDAKSYYQELAVMKDKTDNFKFHHYLYQIQLISAMGVFNYEAAKNICIQAIASLKQKMRIIRQATVICY